MLDVREPDEFTGPLGHIRGATLVPLGELAQRAKELPKRQADRRGVPRRQPLGARHGDPAEGGLRRIANLPGGMLRWRAEGRGVEGGSS